MKCASCLKFVHLNKASSIDCAGTHSSISLSHSNCASQEIKSDLHFSSGNGVKQWKQRVHAYTCTITAKLLTLCTLRHQFGCKGDDLLAHRTIFHHITTIMAISITI